MFKKSQKLNFVCLSKENLFSRLFLFLSGFIFSCVASAASVKSDQMELCVRSIVKNPGIIRQVSSQKVAAVKLSDNAQVKESKASVMPRKKIMVAWSTGGGCHISMLKALETYLGDTYDVAGFKPISDVLYPLDPVYKITRHMYRGEDLYNYLLAGDMPWLVNKLVTCGARSIKRHHKRVVHFLEEYLRVEKPAAVISVIPYFNSAFVEACKRLQIPFLVTIPDCIKSNFLFAVPKDADHVSCTIPIKAKAWVEDARALGIDSKIIKAFGFPLRLDFFELKNKQSICADFSIPNDKPIVMLLMGGAGSSKLIKYVKHLVKFSDPMHLLVCVGRGVDVGEKIKNIKRPQHITISVIGYTTRISDLMAVSDVLLTKTGPGTLFEAIEMQVPIIADATSTILEHERPYVDAIKELELGEVLTGFGKFRDILHNLLTDPKRRLKIRQAMRALSNRDYPEKIKKIVAEMLAHPVKKNEPICVTRRTRVGLKRP